VFVCASGLFRQLIAALEARGPHHPLPHSISLRCHQRGLQDGAEGSQYSPSWRWTRPAAGTGQPMATGEELHRGARCRRRSRI